MMESSSNPKPEPSVPVNVAMLVDETPGGKGSDGRHSFQKFPQRLMTLLDNELYPEAAWWMNEGAEFALHIPNFTQVLLESFQGTKYKSYTRKLNKW